MRLYEARIELEAEEVRPGLVPLQWTSPATVAKICFPDVARMAFVSEAPIVLRWELSPLAPAARVVQRVRIQVPEVPLTMWIDLPTYVRLEPGREVTARMPPEIKNPEGPWPNVVLS